MKRESWAGHPIRFVERSGEWWAVAQDVCEALGLRYVTKAMKSLKNVQQYNVCDLNNSQVTSNGKQALNSVCDLTNSKATSRARDTQTMNIIGEKDIYRLIFKSRKPEAEAFQDWVYETIRELRKASGLEGYETFKLLDKEHQKEAMKKLHDSIAASREPVKVDYIKANTIANKAVCNRHGIPKMVGKAAMSAEMLKERERVLEDVITLMELNERYGAGMSVSAIIYSGEPANKKKGA